MLTPIQNIRRGDWIYPVHPDVQFGTAAKVVSIGNDDDENTTTLELWVSGFRDFHGYELSVTLDQSSFVDTFEVAASTQNHEAA